MAARLLRSGMSARVVYARGLQSQWARRAFSSQGRDNPKETTSPLEVKDVTGDPLSTWLDIKAGIFGPRDARLPLPGNVGMSKTLEAETPQAPLTQPRRPDPQTTPDILTRPTNFQHQYETIEQTKDETLRPVADGTEDVDPRELLECKAQECPELLKKDFQDLFPGRSLRESPLAVVTLCQRTSHDMSSWSEEMELEREERMEYFVLAARVICRLLEAEGYWADFIDPSSGRPHLGRYTNATLFETDERYRHLGFRIEDEGCCKIISHRMWGTKVFVGAIFTNAPVNSDVMEEVINNHGKAAASS